MIYSGHYQTNIWEANSGNYVENKLKGVENEGRKASWEAVVII